MKIICHNQRMLDTACQEMYRLLKENGELALDFDKPYKDKTKLQLGFFFGAIVKSIVSFYKDKGIEYSQDEVKTNFYQAISPRKTVTQFNGKQYETWKHISEMSLEEMSEFIDKALWLCDNAHAFQGLVLHPSIRYTWIRHLTDQEIIELNKAPHERHSPEYLEYQRKQCCLVCGRYGCEAHHIKEPNKSGVAYKADDVYAIPLCPECHRMYHTIGKEWFNEQIDWILKYISIDDFCLCCYNRWKNKY
jgi:hypothetical protein